MTIDDDNKYWRLRKKPVLILVGCIFLLWSYFLITSSNTADYSIRTKVSEMMVLSSVVKETLYGDFIKNQAVTISETLDKGNWPNSTSRYLDYFYVTERGKFFLFSEELGVLLIFTPNLQRDKQGEIIDVTWVCHGLPGKYVAPNCRR
jgi:hypothetical protein